MRFVTVLVLLLVAAPAVAQTPGNCQLGTAEADLDVSDVRARVFNTGSLFFGNTTTAGNGYLVSKGTGHSPIFAAGIWVGGFVGDDLRVAGSTYADFEFWPGPLEPSATLPDEDCSTYDEIWVIDAYDLAYYEATGEATADLAAWPVALGAPVVDGDGVEGNYDLEAGDRPEIYGHQVAFWVMNDVGNVHASSDTAPIGLEVRVTAFSSIEAALGQQTFYRYELVNRNTQPFEEAHVAFFIDPDLGDAADDYVGSDSTRGLAFAYNGDDTDAVYGSPPPAIGYDLLTGAAASMTIYDLFPTEPSNGAERYNFMQGLWADGVPLTEGGSGYGSDGPVLTWVYPGDPEAEQFWSEVNVDGDGSDTPPGDRQNILSSPPFALAPGESRTFDLAILFATGDDYLNSVTALKALSDDVQARYDADALFAPSALTFPPPGTLTTPEPLTPEDGAFIFDTAELTWTPIPGAEGYRVSRSSDLDFSTAGITFTSEPSLEVTARANEVDTTYWRVQAVAGPEQSFFSEARSYTTYRYVFDSLGGGDGIVETAYPGADVCPDEGDPGCAEYGGNTVYLDPNATDDYFLTSNTTFDAVLHEDVIGTDDFELRFTETCATFGACLGAYLRDTGEIVSVPFELWNIRDEEDASDDVRMIPLVRTHDNNPLTDWANTFTDTREVFLNGEHVEFGVTDRIFFLMPDRPNGYALFEEAANGFGGPGAIYDPEADGDTQIDLNANGETCARQGWYVDFCYGAIPPYRAPIGGSGTAGVVVADLAGDGTTPPAGTTVRFITNDPLVVNAEPNAPATPEAFALEAAYPNPFRSSATVAYRLAAAADVRLAVYDVLGRRVRVLHEGPTAAGAHRAQFDSAGLASGVYLVMLEGGGQRQARKVMLVR